MVTWSEYSGKVAGYFLRQTKKSESKQTFWQVRFVHRISRLTVYVRFETNKNVAVLPCIWSIIFRMSNYRPLARNSIKICYVYYSDKRLSRWAWFCWSTQLSFTADTYCKKTLNISIHELFWLKNQIYLHRRLDLVLFLFAFGKFVKSILFRILHGSEGWVILNVRASGPKSIARGQKSVARGPKSIARGPKSIAKGYNISSKRVRPL